MNHRVIVIVIIIQGIGISFNANTKDARDWDGGVGVRGF